MKCAVAILFACLAGATAHNAAVQTGSPVERVVQLLTDLQARIVEDGKVEQKMYDKTACWCEKATAAKAEAIERAQKALRALGQEIMKLKGKIAVLSSEIAELEASIKENLESQAEATALRQKENAAFMAETTELKQALAALERAIAVLIKGTTPGSAAFLQSSTVSKNVQTILASLPRKVKLSAEQMSFLSDLAEGKAKYMPQSLTVQGILTDMYTTFAKDLETKTNDEATSNTDYEAFIAAKEQELIEMREIKAQKEQQKADAEESLAVATQSYDDTNAQMKADIAFFDETKEYCQAVHEEWTARKGLRDQELDGIKQAIDILSSDDARTLFDSSIKAGKEVKTDAKYDTGIDIESFLQLNQHSSSGAPMRAYSLLKSVAAYSHSLRLAQLAVSVRSAKVGHFDKVIDAINTMIQTLKDEESADIAKRDQCKEEYTKINSTISDLNWKIKNNLAKIDKLEGLIEKRTAEKLQTIEDIAQVTSEIAAMEQQRIEANQAFLSAKKEDTDAIELLMQARDVLSEYYNKNNVTMGPVQGEVKGLELAQQGPDFDISNTSRPEFDLSGKGSRKTEAKGIVSILTMIIEDLNDEIKNGMKSEEEMQLEFEKQLKTAKDLKASLEEKKVNLENTIAKREEEKSEEHEFMNSNKADLADEISYKAAIKPDCDWILGAFSERDAKREAEMNALVKAKEFLAGANFGGAALIQGKEPANQGLTKFRFLKLA